MCKKRLAVFAVITWLAVAGFSSSLLAAEPAAEGITVHGEWTITVTDPKSGDVRVYEFSNAVTDSGGKLLEHLLWDVATPACYDSPLNDQVFCPLGQAVCDGVCIDKPDGMFGSNTLAAKVLLNGSDELAGEWRTVLLRADVSRAGVFTASWTSDTFYQILYVGTVLGNEEYADVQVPIILEGDDGMIFSWKQIDIISVETGQLVNIKVDISFG